MITTLLGIWFTTLRRDRVAQAMVFLLPVLFFTIFAAVFGGAGGGTSRVPVAVVDESRTKLSARLVKALQREQGLRVTVAARPAGAARDAAEAPLTRERALAMVKDGDVPVAIVLPAGIDTSLMRFDGGGQKVVLLADRSDRVAPQVVMGLLQKVAMTAAPDVFARHGIDAFNRFGGGLTPAQRTAIDAWLPTLEASAENPDTASQGAAGRAGGLLDVDVVDVLGDNRSGAMVSFYAAGIAVMFLLFSCSAGAGTMLDELDSGTLERVISTRVGMRGLLAAKWLYLTLLGCLQITVMFVYGMLVFHLDLLHHLPGFAVMTAVTAATAAGFGLVLATASRTRAQLSGLSTILILTMSALGGSMFPRFLMSAGMQKAGLVAFNAWALDGFVKVFWRNSPVSGLWPQVAVLLGFLAVFLVVAQGLAKRWERA